MAEPKKKKNKDYTPFGGLRGNPLSETELRSLWYRKRCGSATEVAHYMQNSTGTVYEHLGAARNKLGTRDTIQCIYKADRLHLLDCFPD